MTDRIDEDGIVAFISNRSFVEARSFDGFRQCVQSEFDFAYIIDLGGDIRTLSGRDGIFLNEDHTIFGMSAAVGIAMSFLVKKKQKRKEPCEIRYIHPCDIRATREEKFAYLQKNPIREIEFETLHPDRTNNWINITNNDFVSLIPIIDKETKLSKKKNQQRAIFRLYSLGVVTARDEWVYDFNRVMLRNKAQFLIDAYNVDLVKSGGKGARSRIEEGLNYSIKWTRAVKNDLRKGTKYQFSDKFIVDSLYRPFVRKNLYFSPQLNEMQYQMPNFFGAGRSNTAIFFSDRAARAPFSTLASADVAEYHLAASSDGFQGMARYAFDEEGRRLDNITDWALEQFRANYEKTKAQKRPITKDAIFYYVYGVLHDPIYREKYAQNLKRDFPRIPFYADFWRWADWGEKMMALHIGYETVDPWPLKRIDVPEEKSRKAGLAPKAMLKTDKNSGNIRLDSETQLTGVPPEAWTYKLGNRSALEWILDQYKEKTPKAPTIREKFNTYRFADHKEKVIDLLKRVTRVSVETMKIVEAMRSESRRDLS